MIKILAATRNIGKLNEIKRLFDHNSIQIKLYFLPDFNITDECPEDGSTFIENATIKSLFYGKFVPDLYSLGEDSGLSVDVLKGAPGIFSSRFSGPNATDEENITKLLNQLNHSKNRDAKFITAICLSKNQKVITTCIGEAKGLITSEKLGVHGFGYDPVFYYPQLKKTFAQLSPEEKNKISHRAEAFKSLIDFLKTHIHQ